PRLRRQQDRLSRTDAPPPPAARGNGHIAPRRASDPNRGRCGDGSGAQPGGSLKAATAEISIDVARSRSVATSVRSAVAFAASCNEPALISTLAMALAVDACSRCAADRPSDAALGFPC